MCQVYHSNASTNQHIRAIIQQSDLTNVELANQYSINIQMVSKWRDRDYQEDKSSRPPKTNGMVERANGTIKNSTIKDTEELKEDLNKFLIYYNTNRKHGGLKKELKVRAPCEAVKSWFDVEPEIFKISPNEFYTIALNGMVQCGET